MKSLFVHYTHFSNDERFHYRKLLVCLWLIYPGKVILGSNYVTKYFVRVNYVLIYFNELKIKALNFNYFNK